MGLRSKWEYVVERIAVPPGLSAAGLYSCGGCTGTKVPLPSGNLSPTAVSQLPMAFMIRMLIKQLHTALRWFGLLTLTVSARAELISLSASGKITQNTIADPTIPIGTPWTFEIIYNTAAPDLDFEATGAPDPTFGLFTNTGAIPALTFFHYRAGTYEVTLDEPADFGPSSNIDITFLGSVHAIDINVSAAGLFPPLGGGAVSFHADFNDSTHTALTSDALPTNTAIGLQSFQESSVTLLPPNGVILGSGFDMSSLAIAQVPEPSMSALAVIGLVALVTRGRTRRLELPRA